jgi:acyl-CoA synthetase (AMP-forming)/AMP-acid ligase II/FixJ family two-component response regulator
MRDPRSTVVVIDDDADLRNSIGRLLRSLDMNMLLFAGVSDFLGARVPDGPTCMVLGARLPGQSGLDFQPQLTAANKHFPIIFIAGYGDIPMSVQAMKGGAIEFLTKPFRDQDLLDSIQLGLSRDRCARRPNAEENMSGRLISIAPSAYDYPLLIKQLLHSSMRHAADQEIVYRDQKRFTYSQLHERIHRLAGGLASLGARPGDTVGVLDWDTHRFLEAFFAVPMMGCVLQTVNVRLSHEQVVYTIEHAGATILLVNEEFGELLAAIRPRLTKVKAVVLMSDSDRLDLRDSDLVGHYEDVLASAPAEYDFPDFDENTQATTFYTSGTTGLPKGVYFSHRQMVLHAIAELAAFGLAPKQGRFHGESVYMPLTPMFHVHAWGFPYSATAAGVKQVYPGRYVPDVLLKLIKTEGVTFTHCVPTVLSMLLDAPSGAEIDLRGLTAVIGGAALPKAVALRAMARGIDIFTGYGMSETGPILTLAHLKASMLTGNAEDEVNFRTKTGRPIPLVEVRVVDTNMRDVPHDGKASGEIVARAPWLTQGYYQNPGASEDLWRGGYMHTNDIANISPDGYLQITDRLKDVIKSGGEWISSLELEDIILKAAGVKEVAVIGVKDDKWGERPIALVVRDSQSQEAASEASIKAHVGKVAETGAISRYAIPQTIVFVDHIERTSVGKIDKKLLRERYAPNGRTSP